MLKARVKLEGIPTKDYANRANVIWYDKEDCSQGGQWGAYIEPKRVVGWQDVVGQSVLASLTAKAALITIVQNGRDSAHGKASWDDISFSAVALTAPQDPVEASPAARRHELRGQW